jgi:hypothetical protein
MMMASCALFRVGVNKLKQCKAGAMEGVGAAVPGGVLLAEQCVVGDGVHARRGPSQLFRQTEDLDVGCPVCLTLGSAHSFLSWKTV